MSTLKGTPHGGGQASRQAGELLSFTDVSKRYRRGSQDLRVLEQASLEVRSGEVVGVVSFQGRDLAALSDGELSRLLGGQIAWAGKSGPGMRMRMLDYVAMPLLVGRGGERNVYARARVALERVGAPGCAEQQWESISDWERALVEVAQAIAGEPAMLLVDDVTDTLGIRETDELTALLLSLSRESQLGVLMSVSDAQATLLSDRIVTLAGGRLTQGPRSPAPNVIEFPEVGSRRRDAERGSI
jgi:predicted ABC-type transport system involved in lysophospholipase L1 biosynthesis ATPase subunit